MSMLLYKQGLILGVKRLGPRQNDDLAPENIKRNLPQDHGIGAGLGNTEE